MAGDGLNPRTIRICTSRSVPAVILPSPATSFACARVPRRGKYRRKTTRNQTSFSSGEEFGRSSSCTIPRLPKRKHPRVKDCTSGHRCFFRSSGKKIFDTSRSEFMSHDRDRYLGMDRAITRRDFINGAAVMVGGTLLAGRYVSGSSATEPPNLTGLRGSHPGSFEISHALRDGTFWKTAAPPADTTELYELVIVGAGIS